MVTGKPTWRRGRWLMRLALWGVLTMFGLALCMAMAVIVLHGGNASLLVIAEWVRRHRLNFAVVHLALIGALWWKWRALVDICYATGRMHPDMRIAALASRLRTTLMLLAVEALICFGQFL